MLDFGVRADKNGLLEQCWARPDPATCETCGQSGTVPTMAKSIPAIVTPAVLRWARKTAGYDIPAAAKKLRESEERLAAWEAGDESPTIAKMRRLSEIYKRPLAVFYLPEPPKDFTVLRDFRRLPEGQSRPYSPKLRYLIRRAQERQEWIAGLLQDRGQKPVPWVGSVAVDKAPQTVAGKLRSLLNVTVREQCSWRDEADARRNWIRRCEAIGVFVFQSNAAQLAEMRGFALPHKLAPVVMLNSRDADAARVFSLMHEMAHLMLGEAGVSNMRVPGRATSSEQRIEVRCNRIAAETLVPSDDFNRRLPDTWRDHEDVIIKRLSRSYRVSREVIARRLADLGHASMAFYQRKRDEYLSRPVKKPVAKGEFRIPRATFVLRDNGLSFSRLALSAYADDEITGPQLSDLLNMKMDHLARMESVIFPGKVGPMK